MRHLVGHGVVLARLWDALKRDTLHHALLIEGPVGVGRSPVARLLAMASNCDGAPLGDLDTSPCGACRSCVAITMGNHPDVLRLEPDADKAGGTIAVEDVREVLRKASYARYMGRRRFVVIEPAEALPPAAANALLKTLEEPPPGTHFVLIASQVASLLPTIRSRCQVVRMGPVPFDALVPWLRARGLAEPERIAAACRGRPALALVPELVQRRTERRDALLTALDGDTAARIAWAQALVAGKRQEWATAVDDVLDAVEDLLRDAALAAVGSNLPRAAPDVAERTAAWGARAWPDGLTRCAAAVEEARAQLAVYVAGRMVLDALAARLAHELGPPRRTP